MCSKTDIHFTDIHFTDLCNDSVLKFQCSHLTGDGFGNSYARNLLLPEKVAKLIVLPTGCLEQTMMKLAPTALAIRYLDLSEQWFDLPTGSRDAALDKIEIGRKT